MKTSEHLGELATALAKAQADFETAARDHKAKVETKTGASYEFNYADFAAYLEVCRKPLGENGLSFVQEAVSVDGSVLVVTRLMHSSGQWIETDPLRLPLIADSRGVVTAQIVGSGITYAKRYSLSSLVGLASEQDDDGNAASGNSAETTTRPREALPPCPACGNTLAVIKGKAEYGGGFLCFTKKDGCGHKWQPGEAPKTEQPKTEAMPAAESLSPKDKKVFTTLTQMLLDATSQETFDGAIGEIVMSNLFAKADKAKAIKLALWEEIKAHPHAPKEETKLREIHSQLTKKPAETQAA